MEVDTSLPETPQASTPSSIASSPRSPNTEQLDVLKLRAQLLALKRDYEQPVTAVDALQYLLQQSRNVNSGVNGLQGALCLVREHLAVLHQHLANVSDDMARRQHLFETHMLEKECEIRLARSEASSYKLAAQARITAVNTLKLAVASLMDDKNNLKSRIKDLEAMTKTEMTVSEEQLATAALSSARAAIQSKTDALHQSQAALDVALKAYQKLAATANALEQQKAPIAELRQQLQAAQTDAATAAEQLMEACDDNARLAEALERSSTRALQAESRAQEAHQKEQELHEALGQMAEEAAELESSLQVAQAETAGLRRMVRSQSPAGNHNSDENIDTEALQEEIEALRAENAELRAALEHSENENVAARRDLRQLQIEAKSLHNQLSDVITGLSSSPQALQNIAANANGRPMSAASASVTSGKQQVVLWPGGRGPTTPTSVTPSGTSAALARVRAAASDSEGTDATPAALLADLREAMAALDTVG